MAAPSWRLVGASVTGEAHLRGGLPCQDAFAARRLPQNLLLLVAADGAGSAPRAREGAQFAVDRAVSILSDALEDGCPAADDAAYLIRATVQQTHLALLTLAEGAQVAAGQYATTLAVALVAEDWMVAGQIGDGVIVTRGSGGYQVLIAPHRGEHVNETLFLTSEPGPASLELRTLAPAPDGIAMMTDGLATLAVHQKSGTAYAPFFDPLLAFAARVDGDAAQEQLASFLASARVSERTGDDKTLILAVRERPGPQAGGDPC